MEMRMVSLPKSGDVLTPQYYGDVVQIRANMTGETGSGTIIAEGKPYRRPEWQDFREYSNELSDPVNATIDLLVLHYGCLDDRDEDEVAQRYRDQSND